MIRRVLLAALAVAIFVGAGAYVLGGLNDKSFRLAEISRDICYSRHGIDRLSGAPVPEAMRIECTRPIRNYEAGQIWRYLIAAAVGATCALLIVGGIAIVLRRRRWEATGGPSDALAP